MRVIGQTFAVSAAYYYRDEAGEKHGPLKKEEMLLLIKQKRISLNAPVFQQGDSDWGKLSQRSELVLAPAADASSLGASAPATENKQTDNLPAAPSVILYYLQKDGAQTGPFTIGQLRSMWQSGSITAQTQYWFEGAPEWRPLINILRLLEPPATPVPAATPVATPQITRARYNTRTGLFTGTTLLLVKLAVQAIQSLGWKVENANESVGIVTFETDNWTWGSYSGISCSLSIQELAPNTFRVIGTGKQNVRGGQLIALNLFGEAKGKTDKVIAKMAQLAQMAPLAR